MKGLRFSFFKDNVCMPLTNTTGAHVEKYRSFKRLLSHNHAALNAIAALEQLYYSGKPFVQTTAQAYYEEILESVFGVIYSYETLSGRPHAVLEAVAAEIDKAVAEDLTPAFSYVTTDVVLPFEQIDSGLKTMVGAKAANLALVKNNLGLPVPEGFAVTAYAFERFLEENRISGPIARELSKISSGSPEEIETISSRIQLMLINADVPADIKDAILKAYSDIEERTRRNVPVAVRSSAIGEDTEATFAGQYRTVLNVSAENIIDAYKAVIASKYSARAISYRLRYGLDDCETPMCAAIIVMIDAEASGVIYTGDSMSGSSDRVRITSLWGLGEQLVDGSAASDTFIIERSGKTIIQREIGRKEYWLAASGPDSIKLHEIPEQEKGRPSIDDETVGRLCRYGITLEEFFGGPQDVEWARDKKGDLFILQSRPLSLAKAFADSTDMQQDFPGHPVIFSGGSPASPGIAVGRVLIAKHKEDLEKITGDAILVAKTASPDYAKVIGRVKGIVTDIGSSAGHLASVAREFGIPAIFDTRNATQRLSDGEMITLSAGNTTIYRGVVEELAKDIRTAGNPMFESPVHRRTRRLLDRVSPLTLIDPAQSSFTPEGCKSMHDIVRFTHEMSTKEMFGLTDTAQKGRSVRLNATIPLILNVIDIGGGLSPGLTTCHTITPEHIESFPMNAIWTGFTHPGITWEGTINFDTKNLMTLFAAGAVSEFGESPGGTSYAILSKEYMNLSAKFGYHFATIDSLCGEDSSQNYISLQFTGGVGNYYGKTLRVAFLGTVLNKLDFNVSLKGDLIEASITRYTREETERRLDLLGRLLASSRLLDMEISNQTDIDRFSDSFFREDYDFLGRKRADQLNNFYTHGGYWKKTIEDGHAYCLQDGSKEGFALSGAAGVIGKVVGKALQDYLDNIEAYYYFPLAVAKGTEMSDGKISARIKPVGGHIDRAGGVAFGIRNATNYFVLRINALEDNVILFEYVNNRRVQRAVVKEKIPNNIWYKITVEVKGNVITGFLDNKLIMEYTSEKPVRGLAGLWTKADSVTLFDELTVEREGRKQVIEAI